MSTQPPAGSQNNDNMDDLFNPRSSAGSSGGTSGGGGNMGTPYTPPPPQPNQRKQNPILYIILGLILGVICICGACVLIAGGSLAAGVSAVANNPTVKAAIQTGQVAFGTGIAVVDVPEKLPSDAKDAGTLSAGQQQTGQLGSFERQVWKYEAHSGENITVAVGAANSTQVLVLTLGVYNSGGDNVAKSS